jgi:hypothetical protein
LSTATAFQPIVEHLIAESDCEGYTLVIDDRLEDDAESAWRQEGSGLPGYLRWRLFEIDGVQTYPVPPEGDPGYMYEDSIDWRKADWQVEGTVKWDGCCNWQTSPKCMIHNCGPESLQRLTQAIERAMLLCYEQMKVDK